MKKSRVSFPVLALGISLAGFALFYLIPFLVSAVYALVNNPVQMRFVGMKNFTELFQNEFFLRGLKNTVIFMSAAIPLSMVCSLLLALAIQKLGRWGGAIAVFFLIPLVLPSASTVNFWGKLFDEHGVLNGLLARMGTIGPDWLQSGYAMGVMVLLFVWKNLGYNAVLFLTGLAIILPAVFGPFGVFLLYQQMKLLPHECIEAAKIDGASEWTIFKSIVVPLVKPGIAALTMLLVIENWNLIDQAIIFIKRPEQYPLSVFLARMNQSAEGVSCAAASYYMIPVLTLLCCGHGYLREGIGLMNVKDR